MVIDEDEGVDITYTEFAEGNWEVKGDVVMQPGMSGNDIQLNTKYLLLEIRSGSGISNSASHSHPLIMIMSVNSNFVKQFFSIISMVQIVFP